MTPVHVFALLTFIPTIVAYHTCYDCARIPYPKDCDHVVKCTQDAICYVEEIVTDGGIVLFNLGCRSKQRCGVTKRRQSSSTLFHNASEYAVADAATGDDVNDPATGDLIVCEDCCQGDHCNSQGCNSAPLPPVGNRGPVCYSCHQHAAEDSCDKLEVCDSTESCFLSPTFSSTDTPLFTSGCRQNYGCSNVALVGKRNNLLDHNCTGCCSTDYCNRKCAAVHNSNTQPATTHPPASTAPTSVVHASSTVVPSSSTTAASPASSMTTTIHQPSGTTDTVIDEKLCKLLGYEYADEATFRTCYKLYTDVPRTWQQARDRCKQDGGDLIVFQNMDEQNYFIHQTQNSHCIDILRFWVGATDPDHDNVNWRWLDGTPINSSFFHAGEPNNRENNEHCVALAQFVLSDNVTALNDDLCSTATNSICEITVKELQAYTTPVTPTHCRNPDYKYVASLGTCYKLYNHVEKTQLDARHTCQHEQADLLVLRNVTMEQYFLDLHFNLHDEQHGRYWLGAERIPGISRDRYDDFRWYNGHVLTSDLTWITGEPNDYHNFEDCLTFSYFQYAEPLHFALNDDKCTMSHFFICEGSIM